MTNIETTVANAMLAELKAVFDSGGTIELRTGAMPSSPSDPDSGTLLVTFTLAAPAFAAPVGGSIATLGAPLAATAVATGVVGHARFKSTAPATVLDMKAGGAVPVLDTDDVLDMLETTVAHGFEDNQPLVLFEGTTATGTLYAYVVDITRIQLGLTPGGAALPMPAPGTYTAAYLRPADQLVTVGSVTGTITSGDLVILFDFGISI